MVKLLQSMWWKVLKHWQMGLIKGRRIFWIMAWKQNAISGATGSSEGIRSAVKNAIALASGEVETVEIIEGKDVVVVGGGTWIAAGSNM